MRIWGLLILLLGPALTAQDVPTWRPAARLQSARYGHCVVRLDDGRLFIAGGAGIDGPLATVELYAWEDNAFTAAADMSEPRTGHSCTLLESGKVLVAGGGNTAAELFNPQSGEWSDIDGGITGRSGHTATRLGDGRVLLAGGRQNDAVSGVIEIYDPFANAITLSAASLAAPRIRHGAALLRYGRVLLAGGSDGAATLSSAELYDPYEDTITAATPLSIARQNHSLVTLPDGRVLAAGGAGDDGELGNAELYLEDEAFWQWVPAGMVVPRANAFAVVAPDSGLVIIAGGERQGVPIGDTETFDPLTGEFLAAGSLTAARTLIAGEVLPDGSIFATGGNGPAGPSAACGILQLPRVNVRFNALEVIVGQTAVATVAQFPSGAKVALTLRNQSGADVSTRLSARQVIAPASGSFSVNVLPVTGGDVGTRFTLTASVGSNSAQGVFDAKAPNPMTPSFRASSSVTAMPIPVRTTFGYSPAFGNMSGNIRLEVGGALSPLTGVGGTIAATNTFVCCIATPGAYPLKVTYSNDPRYASVQAQTTSVHNVVARRLTINNTPATDPTTLSVQPVTPPKLPLFTDSPIIASLVAPAEIAPPPNNPVIFTRAGFGPVTVTPFLTASQLSSEARTVYKAGFADKPEACFNVQAAATADYPAASANLCYAVQPATTTIQLTPPSSTYTFGVPFTVNLALQFPAELGITNRTLSFTSNAPSGPGLGFPDGTSNTIQAGEAGTAVSLTAQVGQATGSATLNLPPDVTVLRARYLGDTDLSPSDATLNIQMAPVPTKTTLAPLDSPTTAPLPLKAQVQLVPPAGAVIPNGFVPAGKVRFLDGTLLLGEVTLVAQCPNTLGGARGCSESPTVTIARPVGVRSITAEFVPSSTKFAPSSDNRSVTVQ